MKRILTVLVAMTLMGGLLAAQKAPANPQTKVRSEMLISTDRLAKHLRGGDVVVLHVGRDRTHYDAGHISGARFLPLNKIVTVREGVPNELPPVQQLIQAFAEVGVDGRKRVVLYGDSQGLLAARAWFTFDYLGQGSRAALLDGGLEKWQSEGRPVSKEASPEAPAQLAANTVEPGRVVGLDAMRDASWIAAHAGSPQVALIDARPAEEYSGAKAGEGVPRAGHIPGAKSVFWMQNLRSKEMPVMKPVAELRRLYAAAGVTPQSKTITYCRTGVQSSHAYFTLKYLGYDVSMYDGSFIEWSNAKETDVEK